MVQILFKSQLVLSGVDPIFENYFWDILYGIKLVYTKMTEDEMLREYEKGIDALTIDPANRLQKKVTVLQERNDRLDKVLDRIDKLEKEIGIYCE